MNTAYTDFYNKPFYDVITKCGTGLYKTIYLNLSLSVVKRKHILYYTYENTLKRNKGRLIKWNNQSNKQMHKSRHVYILRGESEKGLSVYK